MFGVTPPGTFDERDGSADLVIGTIALDDEVQIVDVSVLIFPVHFLAASSWPHAHLGVQIETFISTEFIELWKHHRLK